MKERNLSIAVFVILATELIISKSSQKSKESVIELSKQKTVDNILGEVLVTRGKDWWLTLNSSSDKF